ncbi:MAG: leucine-rich repeat protein [Lachnospiraceae bacterium]
MNTKKIGKRMLALTMSAVMLWSTPAFAQEENVADITKGIQSVDQTSDQSSSDFEIKDGVLLWYRGTAESVVIPDGVTKIGQYAFSEKKNGKKGNPHLRQVTIPGSVKSLGSSFFHCQNLEKAIIKNGTEKIGSNCFLGCKKLTEVNIPESVTKIASDAFYPNPWEEDMYDYEADKHSRNVCIYGKKDSYAQKYAKKYKIPFSDGTWVWKAEPIIEEEYFGSVWVGCKEKPYQMQIANCGDAELKFQIKDQNLAVVNKKGKITAKKPGVTSLVITAEETNIYKEKQLTLLLRVAPKKQTAKIKAVKNGLSVTWKKDKHASGYQLQYSTDKKFKKAKQSVMIAKNTVTSKTIKNIKVQKKYYARVRAYLTVKVNGKTEKIYGNWSSV